MSIESHIVHPKFTTLFRDTFGLNENEFEMLLYYFEMKLIPKKEFYLKPGKVCRHKAYVNKGCLRNYVIDEQGHERVLFFPMEDWWVADIDSYYSGEAATNFIQAIEDCELLEISKENFLLLENKIPKLSQWYSVKMTRRATTINRRMEELKTMSPKERYLDLLKTRPDIFQRIPLQYIASYLNIEPQSLSRLRKQISGH
jgi:CRP-like cAMP-binding protein